MLRKTSDGSAEGVDIALDHAAVGTCGGGETDIHTGAVGGCTGARRREDVLIGRRGDGGDRSVSLRRFCSGSSLSGGRSGCTVRRGRRYPHRLHR